MQSHVTAPPFRAAVAIEPLGDGRLGADAPGLAPEPLAISADFLRAPDPGPVTMATEVLKTGRTASVVAVRMQQDGTLMMAASVTAGRLPDDEPRWWDLPDQPAEPPADA